VESGAAEPNNRPILTRRHLLLGGASLAVVPVVAACTTSSDPTVPEAAQASSSLLGAFPPGDPFIPAGVSTRLAYMILDSEGVPLSEIPGEVTFTVSKDGARIAEQNVAPRSEGIPRAYLPLVQTFDEEGIYDIGATFEGEEMVSQLQVFSPSEVISPVVGQQLPAKFTATEDNPGDVDPICTLVPPCPFHTVNLEDVVGTGKPIVLLVATPAFCQTAFCGPTLGNLIDLADGRDDLIVIHSEVYLSAKQAEDDLATAPLAPVPADYGLNIEPVLYVTDDAGVITARADAVVDRSEMAELIN